jgi:hypothetical protein
MLDRVAKCKSTINCVEPIEVFGFKADQLLAAFEPHTTYWRMPEALHVEAGNCTRI